MKKIMFRLLVVISLFAISISQVQASNIIDFSKTGSIQMVLSEKQSDTPIHGVGLTALKIAGVNVKDNNLVLENMEEYKTCGLDFTTLKEEDSISEGAAHCFLEHALTKNHQVTDENGQLTFHDLELGLYLIVQPEEVKGYSTLQPFTLLIPQVIENDWVYEIFSEPKTEIKRLIDISITKEWNNEGQANPKKVEIELTRDERVIETITLSEENNWTYTIEDLEMSDKYSVREVNVPNNYTVSYRNEGYHFIVTNTAKLPQTGMVLWKIELMAGVGIICLIVGIYLSKKHEKV
ncbi:MAG: Cna B-type domain-containing protein [Bacilli bacterium]|nr:Cna B-type domain-containing protein [Bacilli bacterium]